MKGWVLVVTPDEGFRAGITARLRQDGYGVVDAADQSEAMGILDHERVDVVVWHCAPNDGWGWILLDHVRGLPQAPPVILLVPKGQVHHGIEGMRRGAFDDLLIPFAWESLQEKVAAALQAAPKAAKKKKTLRQRWEDFMVAAAFAEAGDPDEARRLIKASRSETAATTASQKKRDKSKG